MCYIGDGNNMANSLIVGGLKTGMKVSIATPADYRPCLLYTSHRTGHRYERLARKYRRTLGYGPYVAFKLKIAQIIEEGLREACLLYTSRCV